MKRFNQKLFLLLSIIICLLYQTRGVSGETSLPTATEVSVTVNPPPSAFSLFLSSTPEGEVDPGADVIYTIIYGNSAEGEARNIKIIARWWFETDKVADYLLQSASGGLEGTEPTVDLTNQEVIWNIPSLPANSADLKLSFRLRTHLTHPYKGTFKFFVQAFLFSGETLVVETEKITSWVTYKEAYPVGVLPPGLEKLQIVKIQILQITAHTARIFYLTNKPSSSRINYGLSRAYGLSVSDDTFVKEHVLDLLDLTPDTLYHFQVVSITETERVESEDLIFRTAKEIEIVPTADIGALLVRSFNLRLLPDKKGTIKLYPEIEVEFEIPIFGKDIVATLIFGGRKIPLTSQKDIFTGRSQTPPTPGEHQITLEVRDKAGNFFQKGLLTIVVQRKPRVSDIRGRPITRAKISLFRYDPLTDRFALFDLSTFDQTNPKFSGKKGEYFFLLPYGRYYLEVKALGFRIYRGPTVVLLQNGIFGEDIVLQLLPASFPKRIFFLLLRFLQNTFAYLYNLTKSLAKLLEKLLLPFLVVSFLSLLLALQDRFGLTPQTLISYLKFRLKKLLGFFGKKEMPIWGEVRDATTGDPITMVEVKAMLPEEKRVVGLCFTNKKGEFGFFLPGGEYLLFFQKPGFVLPKWERVKTPGQKALPAILFSRVVFGEKKTIWLKPIEFPEKFGLGQNIYAFLKSLYFTLADFILISGLLLSLSQLHLRFTSKGVLITLLYLLFTLLWAILAFKKVKI